MEEIKAYKTKDGKIFIDKELAEEHESIIIKVDTVMNLLGGYNKDIDPNSCEFANGGGYVTISSENLNKANILIEELKDLVGLSDYSIKNIRCYENDYIGVISSTLYCIVLDNGEYLRYGQQYYAQNQNQAKNIEFKKEI